MNSLMEERYIELKVISEYTGRRFKISNTDIDSIADHIFSGMGMIQDNERWTKFSSDFYPPHPFEILNDEVTYDKREKYAQCSRPLFLKLSQIVTYKNKSKIIDLIGSANTPENKSLFSKMNRLVIRMMNKHYGLSQIKYLRYR